MDFSWLHDLIWGAPAVLERGPGGVQEDRGEVSPTPVWKVRLFHLERVLPHHHLFNAYVSDLQEQSTFMEGSKTAG